MSRSCPWPRAGSTVLTLLLLLLAAPAAAEVRLEVSGLVEVSGEDLVARVVITNRGAATATGLTITGELLGAHAEARLDAPVPPGAALATPLRFPLGDPAPGVHLLALRLDYTRGAAGSEAATSQRAFLLVALGQHAPPVVTVTVGDTELRDRAEVPVTLTSIVDGPQRVRVALLTPRGLNPHGPPMVLDVPARGTIQTNLPVLRGGAPRLSRQGILVSATTVGAPVQSTTVATGVVQIAPDPAWMPGLRKPLAGLALLLLVLAAAAEIRRAQRR